VPLVFDAHTLLTSELPSYDLGIPRWLTRTTAVRGDRWLPRLADHVASCTERIRTRLLEIGAVPADRVTVVPNGVELLRFETGGAQRSSGVPKLVFTGNLARYQGIDLMLAALKLVRERRPRTRLTVVTAESFDEYEGEARALGVRDAIDLVPASVSDEPRLIAAADVALNPRVDCDGIPMKLLNYMAAGRPVVSFAGSAPGLVHGQTAWLARDGDVEGFAAGIITLLDEPAFGRRMADNARRFVQANHTWAHSAALAEEMYDRLLTPVALAR
jgi:glycosyltransferase involved in cell wall biosynthesis